MLAIASSTPLQSPPVNGRPPYRNTIGLPRARVSSKRWPSAVALRDTLLQQTVWQLAPHKTALLDFGKVTLSMQPAQLSRAASALDGLRLQL